jgi:N-succinyldiaminopimelate aminotransferase
MNPDLRRLQAYPFEKLAALKQGIRPPQRLDHIALSIGEPKHATPRIISDAVTAHLQGLASYPSTRGTRDLREAIATWLLQRFRLGDRGPDPERQILPVSGTREALFAFCQAVSDRSLRPLVMMPNPFYQIYEGAALLAGAEPRYLPCTRATGFLPDFQGVSEADWRRCQLLYLCSPGNPTGAVLGIPILRELIELAERFDFIIAADECYSELYPAEDHPPPGLLEAAHTMGNTDFHRCVVFHSLSKRSNAPGLRSGFVAGDARVLERFFLYRTYQGCAMPPHHQAASTVAWRDESHVQENRRLYREKFAAVLGTLGPVLGVKQPDAGFYLWPETPQSDTEFTRGLYAAENVTVLPGSFLSREIDGVNPGGNHVRMALVAPLPQCVEAAQRIRHYVESL